MRIRYVIFLLLLPLLPLPFDGYCQAGEGRASIRVMTYNIRYNDGSDGLFSWENRKALLLQQIVENKPDLAGMQEVMKGQLDFLAGELSGYKWFGVGREDGKQAGEYAPVFYKADRFILIDSSYFWLSATPDVPKPGWNASCIRIVTWVKLQDKKTGKQFYFFNTHFDHVGHRARRKSAHLLLHKLKAICGNDDFILSGDFNFSSKNRVYRILTRPITGIVDTKTLSDSGHSGPDGSFVGFPYRLREHSDIDMIFVPRAAAKVSDHTTIPYEHSGTYPSDHLPVITTIQFIR